MAKDFRKIIAAKLKTGKTPKSYETVGLWGQQLKEKMAERYAKPKSKHKDGDMPF